MVMGKLRLSASHLLQMNVMLKSTVTGVISIEKVRVVPLLIIKLTFISGLLLLMLLLSFKKIDFLLREKIKFVTL